MNGDTLQTSSNLIGTVLLGRYRVVRELAKGGMGVVYLARAEGAVGFVKPYVIKLVLPEHADNQRFIQMFVREANILANLRHPGVVSVIELGEREEDGALVMVLEYVRGYHLGQWAKYVRLKKRAIPIDILLQLMIEVLDALHYAHTMAHPDGTPMHIVHRDISPSNILLDEDGRARLLDFGVARMRGGNQDYHTQAKGFVGKLMYSAPELFAEAEATAQSDCYSCAVVLHEILMGRNVFRGESQAATLNRVLNHVPESLEPQREDLPKGLDAILAKGLAKLPRDRYADAREFAGALRTMQREPESEVRARLAALLKVDFGQDMAEMLGLESLADRDEAWRRLSHHPLPRGSGHADPDFDGLEPDNDSAPGNTVRPRTGHTGRNQPVDVTAVRVPRHSATSLRRVHDSSRTPLPIPPPPPPSAYGSSPGSTVTVGPPLAARGQAAPPRGPRAVVTVLLIGGAVLLALVVALRSTPEPRPAAPLPPIRVVTETREPRNEPTAPPDDGTQSAVPEREVEHTKAVDSMRRPNGERRERSQPDAVLLTRAVRKQQSKIESCFAENAADVEALPAMQLEFDLAESGKLDAVRVLPPTLASTPLGKCLERVATGTRFPAQSRSVSFAIPITASRTAGN